jgi:hypothetical protein
MSAYVDTDGTLKFAVIMAPADQEWWWYPRLTEAEIQPRLTQNQARLTDMSAYVDTDGTLKFAVIMAPADQEWWWYPRLTEAEIQPRLTQNQARLTVMSPFLLPTLTGHVYKVTEPTDAFFPVIFQGDQAPATGFEPWPNLTVTATYYSDRRGDHGLGERLAITQGDGSFSIPGPPLDFPQFDRVALTAEAGIQGLGIPYYRSPIMRLDQAAATELDIWLYPDTVPASDGITAGAISQLVSSAGIPTGVTVIDSTPGSAGLRFFLLGTGYFVVGLSPDWSPDLGKFIDLSLVSYDISVDFPSDLCESAHDVVNKIKAAVAQANGSVNPLVLNRMESVLQTQDSLSASQVKQFLEVDTSVTLMNINYPTLHLWWANNTSDSTVVVTANPCIGWPRDPSLTDPQK